MYTKASDRYPAGHISDKKRGLTVVTRLFASLMIWRHRIPDQLNVDEL